MEEDSGKRGLRNLHRQAHGGAKLARVKHGNPHSGFVGPIGHPHAFLPWWIRPFHSRPSNARLCASQETKPQFEKKLPGWDPGLPLARQICLSIRWVVPGSNEE